MGVSAGQVCECCENKAWTWEWMWVWVRRRAERSLQGC